MGVLEAFLSKGITNRGIDLLLINEPDLEVDLYAWGLWC